MKSVVLVLASLVALPATAEAPEAAARFACANGHLYVQIAAPRPGVFTIELPQQPCGPDV